MKFNVTIDCDNSAFESRPGAEVARMLRVLAQAVSDQDPGFADVTHVNDTNGHPVLTARWIEPLYSGYDPEQMHVGYRNYITFKVIAEIENDGVIYEALLAYVRELLTPVPNMTPQAVGVNIKRLLQIWAKSPDTRPKGTQSTVGILNDLRKVRWEHVNEEDLGGSWLAIVRDLEES